MGCDHRSLGRVVQTFGNRIEKQQFAYSASDTPISASLRKRSNPPTCPLCMKLQRPQAKGWQLLRLVAEPVEARTWAMKAWLLTVLHSAIRFGSDHAG